MSIICYT